MRLTPIRAWLLTLLAVAGCATAPALLEETERGVIDVVEVLPTSVARSGWKLDADVLREASLAAAAARHGAGALLQMPDPGTCQGWPCGAAALAWLTVVTTAAAVEAARGVRVESDRNAAKRAASPALASMQDVADELDAAFGLHAALLDALGRGRFAVEGSRAVRIVTGQDPAPANPVELVSEIAGIRLDEVKDRSELAFTLRMLVRFALHDPVSGSTRYEGYRQAQRGPQSFEAWVANDAQAFREALAAAYRELAAAVVEESLLVYRSDDRAAPATEYGRGYFLTPVEPPPVRRKFPVRDYEIGFGSAGTALVTSRQPRLRWTELPVRGGRRGNDFPLADVEQQTIRYDVRVFDGNNVVTEADALPRPEFRVPVALAPCRSYFWTVRARFLLRGRERVTDWSGPFNGSEPWNAGYPLVPGMGGHDDVSTSAFRERVRYFHRFHVGSAWGSPCRAP